MASLEKGAEPEGGRGKERRGRRDGLAATLGGCFRREMQIEVSGAYYCKKRENKRIENEEGWIDGLPE